MKQNILKGISIVFLLIILVNNSFAHGKDIFDEARELVDSGVSCSELTKEELAYIGDYYMEQIHPGEEHERMDAMMGGEESFRLEAMHISMAERYYCDDNVLPTMHSLHNWGALHTLILSVFVLIIGAILFATLNTKNTTPTSKKKKK